MTIKDNDRIQNSFVLRRTVGPYALYPILIIFLILIGLPYMLKTGDWSLLEGPAIVTFFFIAIVYFGTRYRIWWKDNKIIRRTAGFNGIFTTITVEDIERIEQEMSDLHTILKLNRPLRRITIYGNTPEGLTKIDVSLKHFNLADVRRLMKTIHEHRPDLLMPKNWI